MIQVTVELSDGAARLLDRLVKNGLHGVTRAGVSEVLICRELEDRKGSLEDDINMYGLANLESADGS